MRAVVAGSLADQLSPNTKGVVAVSVVVVGVAVIAGIAIVAVISFRSLNSKNGNTKLDSRIGVLRHNRFDGSYSVDINPVQWGLGPSAVRAIAVERGYVEVAPSVPQMMSFVLSSTPNVSRPDGSPRVSMPNYAAGATGAGRVSSRESWLLRKIRVKESLWVSMKHLGISRSRLEWLLSIGGRRIASVCADNTDQVIRLCDPGSAGRSLTVSTRGVRPTVVVLVLMYGTCLGLLAGSMACFYAGRDAIGVILIMSGSIVRFIPYVIRVVNRSKRASLLGSEFRGERVSVFLVWYGFSDCLVSEMARSYGYAYVKKSYSGVGGPYIKYIRAVQ